MTLHKSSTDSTNAITIFLNPGNLDIDLSGRSTLRLLNTDKLGMIGRKEAILTILIVIIMRLIA